MPSCSRLVLPLPRWLWLPWALCLLLLAAPAAAQTGTVTGTVTDAVTGLPITGAQVSVLQVNSAFVTSGSTDASGVYNLAVPPGALYYVSARSGIGNGHPQVIHPDFRCPLGCLTSDLLLGTSFSVTSGGTVTKDFALQPGGRITGTITNAAGGAPIASVSVTAWIRVGTTIYSASTSSNASGVYNLVGLPPGNYVLGTSNSAGFRNEVFDNVPCVGGCSSTTALASGTPVAVTAGAATTGRDFALDLGGRITGVITNAATGAPQQNVSVFAYTRVAGFSTFAGSGFTNAAGEYAVSGLATGTYYLFTSTTLLTNEVYPDILCPVFCSSNTALDGGTGVPVTLGAPTPGINFALDPGGSISGTVTNEATGLPAQSVAVNVVVRTSATGTASRSVSTNASGDYTITGLPTGTYQLFTNSNQFANEIFDNLPCVGFCQTTAVNTGTPVSVTSGSTTGGRNFALQPVANAGAITGTITDAASGLPIAGIGVEVWTATGTSIAFLTTATTNTLGVYSVTGLPSGTYRVDTFGNHTYRNEAFDNFPCTSQFCSTPIIQGSTPVTVSTGPSTANFALNAGDGILGTVTSAAGALLQGVNVQAFQVPSGTFAGSSSTNSLGRFAIRGLTNGTYVLLTSNSLGFTDEIFDNIACPSAGSCSVATAVASGTRITLSGAGALNGSDVAELVTGIDFSLATRNAAPGAPSNLRIVTSGGTAQFTWSAPSLFNAGAPTSYLLEAGLSPGTTFITLPIAGTGTTFSVPGVPPGTYFVRIRAVNAAGTGPASNEVTLSVGAGGTGIPDPPTNVFAFMSGRLLTLTWTPPLGGGPPSGYVVEAGSASGSANIASLNVTGAVFSFSPVPDGFYFLRVRTRNAAGVSAASTEVMINVGNVPAPPGAPNFTGASASSGTVTLNWQAPTQGTATSYIIEAGSATGLSNLATVNTGSTATTQSFTGVPPGTYYIRIRAVNAQGASVASNERILTVS